MNEKDIQNCEDFARGLKKLEEIDPNAAQGLKIATKILLATTPAGKEAANE